MKLLAWLCTYLACLRSSVLVGMTCLLMDGPVQAQQQAVFSGGSTKSTLSGETNSNLRTVGGPWIRQTGSEQPTTPQHSNPATRSYVVPAGAEQPLSGSEQQFPPTATRSGNSLSTNSAVAASANTAPRIPLSEPGPPGTSAEGQAGGLFQTIMSVGSSLLIVVGLFLGVAWCYRRTLSTSISGGLPKHVVNVLGRTPLAARQQLVLVRFGSKLVLVSLVQGEARTISEITDPLEVDRLAGLCESQQPGSISQSFRSVLSQGSAT